MKAILDEGGVLNVYGIQGELLFSLDSMEEVAPLIEVAYKTGRGEVLMSDFLNQKVLGLDAAKLADEERKIAAEAADGTTSAASLREARAWDEVALKLFKGITFAEYKKGCFKIKGDSGFTYDVNHGVCTCAHGKSKPTSTCWHIKVTEIINARNSKRV